MKVVEANTQDVLDAAAVMLNLVRDRKFRHAGYPELNAAVKGAVRREVRDRWTWGRKNSTADISPLESVTLAVWLAGRPVEVKKPAIPRRIR